MQTLGLAAHLFGYVHSGMKHVTIRKGHVNVRLGELLFRGHGHSELVVVTQVHHTVVRRLLPSEYRGDGATSVPDLLKGLKAYYPDLRLDSPVTVITFHRTEQK